MIDERSIGSVESRETTHGLVRHDVLVAPDESFRVRDSEAGGFDHHIRLLNILPIELEVVDGNNPDNKQNTVLDEGKVYGKKDTYRLYPQPVLEGQRQFIIVAKKGVEVESVESVEAD